MTDELSLDHETVAMQLADGELAHVAPPADPWLARRTMAWGASEVPALLLALGLARGVDVPDYIARRARATTRARGQPRIIAEKAGLVAPLRVGRAAHLGTEREQELLEQWRAHLERGSYRCEAEELVIPATVRHASVAPRCSLPWVDRHCTVLAATPDAWADDALGAELLVELKCSTTERRELPWHWMVQVQAQLAVIGAQWGLVVCGEYWAAEWAHDGPIRAWEVPRDEALIETIRDACREGWRRVEALRAERNEVA